MHAQTLHLLNTLTLLTLSSAQDADDNPPTSSSSLPSECQTICNPVAQLVTKCQDNVSRDTSPEKQQPLNSTSSNPLDSNCICEDKSFDVKSATGLCSSCLGQNSQTPQEVGMIFFSNFIFARGKAQRSISCRINKPRPANHDCSELDQIMSRCKFPATSYAPTASLVQSIQVTATATTGTPAATATTTATATSDGGPESSPANAPGDNNT